MTSWRYAVHLVVVLMWRCPYTDIDSLSIHPLKLLFWEPPQSANFFCAYHSLPLPETYLYCSFHFFFFTELYFTRLITASSKTLSFFLSLFDAMRGAWSVLRMWSFRLLICPLHMRAYILPYSHIYCSKRFNVYVHSRVICR